MTPGYTFTRNPGVRRSRHLCVIVARIRTPSNHAKDSPRQARGPTAKWEKRMAWPLCLRFRGPAIRIESLGIGIKPRISMYDVLARHHNRSSRDPVTADLAIRQRLTVAQPNR